MKEPLDGANENAIMMKRIAYTELSIVTLGKTYCRKGDGTSNQHLLNSTDGCNAGADVSDALTATFSK